MSKLRSHQRLHYVYFLESTVNKRLTYIGYTVDLTKRLRKHNGEITGGAKYTRKGRPWRMVCYLAGFPDETIALQFEWRNHHPGKRLKRGSGILGRLRVLAQILKLPNFTTKAVPTKTLKLLLVWLDLNYMQLWQQKIKLS